jgi:ATP-binding cassette subfamily C (CFTR/MRP) protein 1
MADITEGNILIDNLPITSIPSELVRSKIVAVPQEPFFLSGTIRSNADPLGLETDFQIIAVLEKVHLWTIVQQQGGLEVMWQEEMFSNGQRQLFCFARSMLNKGAIVVLDEPTSGCVFHLVQLQHMHGL